jgi:hypothetical protein
MDEGAVNELLFFDITGVYQNISWRSGELEYFGVYMYSYKRVSYKRVDGSSRYICLWSKAMKPD